MTFVNSLAKIVLVVFIALFSASASNGATTYDFSGTSQQALDGVSLNGWTFSGNWRVYERDLKNIPFMESYDTTHSVSYDAGVVNFQSMSLGGLPWDNYDGGGDGFVLNFSFRDLLGDEIWSDSISLTNDNNFHTYSKSIAGVREIYFSPSGGNIGPEGQWVYGFWPRLASITTGNGSPVPEPSTVLLVGIGLLGLAYTRRRANS
jgi:hypothetical protein